MLDEPRTIKLAKPREHGSVSLERCIRERRSIRGFRDQALTENALGQLLWAAQGLIGVNGRRSVPSAGALYPLELYVAISKVDGVEPGVFRYRPERHELLLIVPGFQRGTLVEASDQGWIGTASVVMCIAAVFERTTAKYGDRGRGYVYMEAGLAAENVMLQAVPLGLATTMVGAFSDIYVKQHLHLATNEVPVCLIPIGQPWLRVGDQIASE